VEYSWKRQNWFDYSAAEHRAAREGVILMDLTPMSKFLVQGQDAQKVLNRICARDVNVEIGRCVYTPWLNDRGTIEVDLTVTRLDEDKFQLVSSWSIHTHVLTWLKRHIPAEAHVFVTDVTSGYALINIQGPKSRQLLSLLTTADMSNEAFPFLTMQEIDLGYAPIKAHQSIAHHLFRRIGMGTLRTCRVLPARLRSAAGSRSGDGDETCRAACTGYTST
jgi:4-methylaminobutanoate oxidase (formaldehyde-forming)